MLAYRTADATAWVEFVPGTKLPDHLGGLWVTRGAEALTTQKLTSLGLRRVVEDAVPAGRAALSWSLQDVAGTPHLVPELSAPPTLEDLQTAKAVEVTNRRDELINAGVTIDFGGTIGPKVLQTARDIDRSSLMTILSVALAFSGMGAGDQPMNPIRTADNTMVDCTVNQALGWMLEVQNKLGDVWKKAATLKDAIFATTDEATLAAIDIDTGWPQP